MADLFEDVATVQEALSKDVDPNLIYSKLEEYEFMTDRIQRVIRELQFETGRDDPEVIDLTSSQDSSDLSEDEVDVFEKSPDDEHVGIHVVHDYFDKNPVVPALPNDNFTEAVPDVINCSIDNFVEMDIAALAEVPSNENYLPKSTDAAAADSSSFVPRTTNVPETRNNLAELQVSDTHSPAVEPSVASSSEPQGIDMYHSVHAASIPDIPSSSMFVGPASRSDKAVEATVTSSSSPPEVAHMYNPGPTTSTASDMFNVISTGSTMEGVPCFRLEAVVPSSSTIPQIPASPIFPSASTSSALPSDVNNNGRKKNEFGDTDYTVDSTFLQGESVYEGVLNSLYGDQEEMRQILLIEARLIHSRIPGRSVEEIYSYLEANMDDVNRLNIVLQLFQDIELMKDAGAIQEQLKVPANSPVNEVKEVNPHEQLTLVDRSLENLEALRGAMANELKVPANSPVNEVKEVNLHEQLTLMDRSLEDLEAMWGAMANELDAVAAAVPGTAAVSQPRQEIPLKERRLLLDMFPDMDAEYLKELSFDGSPQWINDTVTRLLETDYPRRVVVEEVAQPISPERVLVIVNTQYQNLLAILPQADPTYLRQKCEEMGGNEATMKEFVANALEFHKYPTMKEYLQRQEMESLQKKYTKEFNVEDFLEIFPDPFHYFMDEKKSGSDTFLLGMSYLKKRYSKIRVMDIQSVFKRHQFNLTRTCKALDTFKDTMKGRRSCVYDSHTPTVPNIPFMQEVAFLENESLISEYLKAKECAKKKAFEKAQAAGDLLECGCCFNGELLMEDMSACEDGHLFCKECIRRGTETQIGDGKTTFLCFGECSSEFSLKTLQGVLKPAVFSRLLHRKQIEEVKAAGIPGLEICPFCDFATIPANEDKVFHCLNPECMKDSCRFCKEPNHVPLHCEEVERSEETRMRTYIEDRMTEALVRTCPKCDRKFIKEDGCNKMRCTCGTLVCYICRQPVNDYSHFNPVGGQETHKCPLFSNNEDVHVNPVKEQALMARQEVLNQNPGRMLKHDPTMILPEAAANGPIYPAAVPLMRGLVPVIHPLPHIGGVHENLGAAWVPYHHHHPRHRGRGQKRRHMDRQPIPPVVIHARDVPRHRRPYGPRHPGTAPAARPGVAVNHLPLVGPGIRAPYRPAVLPDYLMLPYAADHPYAVDPLGGPNMEQGMNGQ